MDNATPDMSERLQQYLDGDLPAGEKDQLERELSANAQLREELENLQLAREAVKSYGLKTQVAAIHADMMQEMQAPVRRIGDNRRILRFSIAIAASVLLVVFAAKFLITTPVSPEKIYADNYYRYELSTTRGEETVSAVDEAYRAQDYKKVIELTDTASTGKDLFLSAMAEMELKQPAAAIERFKKVLQWDIAHASTDYMDASEFYLALAFVANKQYEFAAGLLEKIRTNPNHTYHERVTGKLVNQVKKLK